MTGFAGADCHGEVCVTCRDEAVPVPVERLLPGGLALVRTPAGVEEISVALVEVEVGDVVLVHAGEAIGVIGTGDCTSPPWAGPGGAPS
jgi:hydrogenase expression/formation protein HypC